MKLKHTERDNIFIALGLVTTIFSICVFVIRVHSLSELLLCLGCTLLLDTFILSVDRLHNQKRASNPMYDTLEKLKAESKHVEYIQAKYANELQDLSQAYNLGWISGAEFERKKSELYLRDE